MEAKARLFGHPIHQMLVVFPLGLLGTSVVFDLIHLFSDSATAATVAHALISAGLIAGLIAAPFGTIDWLAVPANTRAKKIGALHGGGNLVVMLLFLVAAPRPRRAAANAGMGALVRRCRRLAADGVARRRTGRPARRRRLAERASRCTQLARRSR
jgi:uncharacterized membrane protein